MQTAKLFPNGQSQAVRLPKEYRFDGDRVYIRRLGGAVVLLPYQEPWQVLFDSLDQFSADYAAEATSSIRDNTSSWLPETAQPAQQGSGAE
jgi:antitoxin VapB